MGQNKKGGVCSIMSLVLATSLAYSYVIMTGDRRVVRQKKRYKGNGEFETSKDYPPEALEKEFEKVFKLSRYTLCGLAGMVIWTDYFRGKMREKVKEGDDLDVVKIKLSSIIKTALEDPKLKYKEFIGREDGFQMSVAGFRISDGTTGILNIDMREPDHISVRYGDMKTHSHYTISGPVAAYKDITADLFGIGENIKTKEDRIKRLKWIQGIISENHPVLVSSHGDLHVIELKSVNGIPKFEHEHVVFDTK